MGGIVQSNSRQASSAQSDSIEHKIAAYQAKGRTRILPEGKLPPGITEKDAIVSVVGEIATNLHTVLEGRIFNYGVSSKDDRDFFADVCFNVNAVLKDPANSSILQGVELPQIDQLINLANSLSEVDQKSIPKKIPEIKKELAAAFDATLIRKRPASTTALSKPSPHSSAEATSNAEEHRSKKKQLHPVQMERREPVVDDTELPSRPENFLEEHANGLFHLESNMNDREATELLNRLQSNPILRK